MKIKHILVAMTLSLYAMAFEYDDRLSNEIRDQFREVNDNPPVYVYGDVNVTVEPTEPDPVDQLQESLRTNQDNVDRQLEGGE